MLRNVLRGDLDCSKETLREQVHVQLKKLASSGRPSDEVLRSTGLGIDLSKAKKFLKGTGENQLYALVKVILAAWKGGFSTAGAPDDPLERNVSGPKAKKRQYTHKQSRYKSKKRHKLDNPKKAAHASTTGSASATKFKVQLTPSTASSASLTKLTVRSKGVTLPSMVELLAHGRLKVGDILRAMPRVAGRQYRLDGTLRKDGCIVVAGGKVCESPSGFCMYAIVHGGGQGKCNGWKSCFHVSADGQEECLDNIRRGR